MATDGSLSQRLRRCGPFFRTCRETVYCIHISSSAIPSLETQHSASSTRGNISWWSNTFSSQKPKPLSNTTSIQIVQSVPPKKPPTSMSEKRKKTPTYARRPSWKSALGLGVLCTWTDQEPHACNVVIGQQNDLCIEGVFFHNQKKHLGISQYPLVKRLNSYC